MIYEKASMITLNDLAEPVTFPTGPISTPAERNLLLSQRAKGETQNSSLRNAKRERDLIITSKKLASVLLQLHQRQTWSLVKMSPM